MGFFPTRPVPDADYLISRAEAEIQMADRAASAVPAEVHHKLASAYLGKLFKDPKSCGETLKHGEIEQTKRAAMAAIFQKLADVLNDPDAEISVADYEELLGRLS